MKKTINFDYMTNIVNDSYDKIITESLVEDETEDKEGFYLFDSVVSTLKRKQQAYSDLQRAEYRAEELHRGSYEEEWQDFQQAKKNVLDTYKQVREKIVNYTFKDQVASTGINCTSIGLYPALLDGVGYFILYDAQNNTILLGTDGSLPYPKPLPENECQKAWMELKAKAKDVKKA